MMLKHLIRYDSYCCTLHQGYIALIMRHLVKYCELRSCNSLIGNYVSNEYTGASSFRSIRRNEIVNSHGSKLQEDETDKPDGDVLALTFILLRQPQNGPPKPNYLVSLDCQ